MCQAFDSQNPICHKKSIRESTVFSTVIMHPINKVFEVFNQNLAHEG